MNKFCFSCAAPLAMPDFKGPAEDYCKYCTDEQGTLKSRSEVQMGVAQWFQQWQPNIGQDQAMSRAEQYLKAMPAWAE
jgi:hypothetical protein